MKRSRARTDPCGTPLGTSVHSELEPPYYDALLPIRQEGLNLLRDLSPDAVHFDLLEEPP